MVSNFLAEKLSIDKKFAPHHETNPNILAKSRQKRPADTK
jgi:hypothetical protein